MTGTMKFEGGGLDALDRALECYGSDRTRWPAPVRRDLAALLAGNADAQRRLAEAEALDRLLDMMPEPEVDTTALASRILAAAEADAPLRPARTESIGARSRARADTPWAAVALLAASLVLGTFVGVSGTFNSALENVTGAAMDDVSTDPGQLAFDSSTFDLFEEDLL